MIRTTELHLLLLSLPNGLLTPDLFKLHFPKHLGSAYNAANRMADDHLFTKSKWSKKEWGKRYPISFLSLTPKGLRHLSSLYESPDIQRYLSTEPFPATFPYALLPFIPPALHSFGLTGKETKASGLVPTLSSANLLSRLNLKMQEQLLALAGVYASGMDYAEYADLLRSDPSESIKTPIATTERTTLFSSLEYLIAQTDPELLDAVQEETEEDEDFPFDMCEAGDETAQPEIEDECFLPATPRSEPQRCTERPKGSTLIEALIFRAADIARERGETDRTSLAELKRKIRKEPIFISRLALGYHAIDAGNSHFMVSLCNGLVLTSEGALLTFHTGLSGLGWSRKGTEKLRRAMRDILLRAQLPSTITSGLLFCRNTAQMTNTFYDKAQKRKRTKLGDGLSNLYLVMEQYESANILQVITGTKDPWIETGGFLVTTFQQYTPTGDMEWPLREPDGTLCYNGLLMEVHSLGRAQTQTRTMSIICFDWQEKYFNILFPENKKIIISSKK